jgi:apolipoprotein N-acyltransferase
LTLTEIEAPAQIEPAAPRPRRRLWLLARLGGAVAAGLALLLAFPPYGQWWTAPIGVAILALTVHGRRPRAGFGYGVLAGAVFFTILLAWTNLHTGKLPWLLLAGLQALYIGLLGSATAWVTPLLRRWRWAYGPLTGALWTAQELFRDTTPFGGFPWGRLAFSQTAASPLLPLAAVGGAPLVTFAVALTGGFLAAIVLDVRVLGRAVPAAAALALVVAGSWFVPAREPAGKPITVAVVQGSVPRLGLDFNAQRRAVLDNHVQATLNLAADVAAGRAEQPALVVWPENSSDIDPLRNADAANAIDTAVRAIKVPILVGAVLVLDNEADAVENAGLVWAPDGVRGKYVKRHPVPFAEYVPMRDLARKVSDKVDLVANEFKAGHTPGVLDMGPAVVGDVICFEVAYDGIVRDTVTGGGQLLAVQTNNATFNPAEAGQQLNMVALRAVEHGRDGLMASTVGISAFVDAHGRVHQPTAFDTQRVIVRELHLSNARTLATRLGAGPEYVIVAAALAALVAAGVLRRRSRRGPGENPAAATVGTAEAAPEVKEKS